MEVVGGDAVTAVVDVSDVSLAYRLTHSHAASFKEFTIHMFKRRVQFEQLWALDDVSLTLRAGEVLGVIGANGAGKSTLMKVIARVLPPTAGRVVVRGQVAPLIELGAGFNLELTGAENTLLYGTLLGRKPAFMRERLTEIARWAELEEYMDVPVRSYSSGMLVRLAFAVAVDVDPELLLVDEVLSVGDERFQQKSISRLHELIDRGTAVLFVSHDLETVATMADRVVWLDRGRIKMVGAPDEVIAAYKRA
jgi:ABC-2 type transport system ATP-binding protein